MFARVFCVVKAMDFNTVDMKPRACLGRIQFFSLCDLSLHSCMRLNLFVIRFLIRASDYIWQLCFLFFNVAGACCDLTKTHGFLYWHGRPVHKKSWRCPSRVLWLTCPWSLRNNGKHHEYCDKCSPSVQFCDMCSKRFWDNPFTRPCFLIRISRKLFQLDLSVIPEESPSKLNADQNTLVFIFYQSDGSSPVVMAQTHHRRNPPFQDPRWGLGCGGFTTIETIEKQFETNENHWQPLKSYWKSIENHRKTMCNHWKPLITI